MRSRQWFLVILVLVPIAFKLAFDAVGGGDWESSGLRKLMIPLAEIFLSAFNSPAVGLFLAFTLFFSAIVFSVIFIFGKASLVNSVLCRAIDRLNEPMGPNETALEHLRSAFVTNSSLEDIFNRSIAISASKPSEFTAALNRNFRLSAFDRSGLSFAFYRQLPDFFVATGLVLTFCGLVAGLFFASRGLMTSDMAVARNSLQQLLSASTMKFLTSISGVGGALLISVVYRLGLDKIERRRNDLLILVENVYAIRIKDFD